MTKRPSHLFGHLLPGKLLEFFVPREGDHRVRAPLGLSAAWRLGPSEECARTWKRAQHLKRQYARRRHCDLLTQELRLGWSAWRQVKSAK